MVLALSTTAVPFRVWMPLSLPGLAVTCFYSFITAWNDFAWANLLLVDNRSVTLPVGLQTYVFQFAADWAKLSAATVLVAIPAVLVFLAAQRYLVSGLTRGGVKG